jgi:N-alpha-acetyltransferase 15/16, NatA auxiliary subunit
VGTLTKHAARMIETQLLAYDVAMKRSKYLLALQALLRGKRLRPTNPDLLLRIVEFSHSIHSGISALHPLVAEVIAAEESTLLDGMAVDGFVASFAERAVGWSLLHRIRVAQAMHVIRPEDRSRALAMITDGGLEGRGVTLKTAGEAVRVVRDVLGDASIAESLRASLGVRFPLAAAFQTVRDEGEEGAA